MTVFELTLDSIRTSELIFLPRMYMEEEEYEPHEPSASTGIIPHEHYTTTLNKEAALIGAGFTKK